MLAGIPYTGLREAILTHPTMAEGLGALFSNVPAVHRQPFIWRRRGEPGEYSPFIESMPFGGVGPAGMGHYYGRYGFEALTHAKSMLTAPDGVAIDHLIPPYDRSKVEALSMWFDYPSD